MALRPSLSTGLPVRSEVAFVECNAYASSQSRAKHLKTCVLQKETPSEWMIHHVRCDTDWLATSHGQRMQTPRA